MKVVIAVALILLAGVLMISPESFWVDESTTAQYSQIGSFGEFAHTLWTDRNSESQMPLYILSVWCWGKLVPATEWALRTSNLVWLTGLFAGTLYISRSTRLRLFPWMFILQPFLWRYVNEFRPYAMQMGFAVWQLAALMDFYENRNRAGRAAIWIAASWGVCAANMLGVVQTAATGFAIFVLYMKRRQWPSRAEWGAFVIGGAAFALLGGYFLHTLLAGAGGAKLWTLSPANLGFALYEMSGAIGLGPSGEALRTAALSGAGHIVSQARPFIAPLFLYVAVLGIIVLAGIVKLRRDPTVRDRTFFLGLIASGGVAGICLLAALVGWPFWGRHLASIFPSYVLLLTGLATVAWQARPLRPVAVVLFLMMGWSLLTLRLSPRFARDDYRQAAALAKQAADEGHRVWWVAHGPAGRFYGLDFQRSDLIVDAANLKDTNGGPAPALVFMSRPEACDSGKIVRSFLVKNEYIHGFQKIPGFTVWQKP